MHRHLARVTVGLVACAALATAACGSSTTSTAPAGAVNQVAMPAGCGRDGAVVLAAGGHRNAPAPVITARMQAAIDAAMASHASIGLMSVQGSPALVQAGVFRSDAGNATARGQDADAFRASLRAAVTGVRATSAHVDDLQALQLSADAVRAACPQGGMILFQDPGLPDRGALNFAASDLLTASPRDVVAFLREHDALPSLAGITVVLDVGNTAAPQQPLTVTARRNLTAIWRAVVTAGGARDVVVDPSPISGPAPAGVPAVDTVRVPADPTYHVRAAGTTVIPLPDSGPVGFVADSAAFRDPVRARQELGALAAQIHNAPHARVSLVGTTSSAGGSSAGAEAGRIALSRARAAAVARVLVSLKVPSSSITVFGVGTRFAQFRTDKDAAGVLLPGPAAQNRSVRVTVVAG